MFCYITQFLRSVKTCVHQQSTHIFKLNSPWCTYPHPNSPQCLLFVGAHLLISSGTITVPSYALNQYMDAVKLYSQTMKMKFTKNAKSTINSISSRMVFMLTTYTKIWLVKKKTNILPSLHCHIKHPPTSNKCRQPFKEHKFRIATHRNTIRDTSSKVQRIFAQPTTTQTNLMCMFLMVNTFTSV